MYISQQLKKQNIAEYLLYMWQVEDLIRANNFDMEKIRETIVNSYPVDEEHKKALAQWYEDLIAMMHDEGVMEKGHIQINRNVIIWLTDLHLRLLRSPKFPYYSAAYYKALPFIVELRAKGADKDAPEIETCFDAMYGVLMLKLQKKEISEDTQKAIKVISDLLAMLSNFSRKQAKLFDGVRCDSGDEFEFIDRLIVRYKELGIDPTTKTIIFSNALDFEKALKIFQYCQGKIRCSFGIGTNLTNDTGYQPSNIVMKLSRCKMNVNQEWRECVKLSDDMGKHMGSNAEVEACLYELRLASEN